MNVSTDRPRKQSNVTLNQFYSLHFFPRICRRLVAKLKILQFLSKVIRCVQCPRRMTGGQEGSMGPAGSLHCK